MVTYIAEQTPETVTENDGIHIECGHLIEPKNHTMYKTHLFHLLVYFLSLCDGLVRKKD